MLIKNRASMLVLPLVISGIITGCNPTKEENHAAKEQEQAMAAQTSEIASLRSNLTNVQSQLNTSQKENNQLKKASSSKQQALRVSSYDDPNTPPDAKPGECYAWVVTPAKYKTEVNTLLKNEKTAKVSITPAKYEWVDKRVMVKEASERLETIEAKYDWVTERVMVRPATTKLVKVAAVYKEVGERVMVSPARTYWKKGTGLISKVDGNTGDIMCLVEEPAKYQVVKKRVVVSEASTKEIQDQPAEYETIRRKVMTQAPKTRKISIPAEYKMVKVKHKIADAKSSTIAIPETYQKINKRIKVSEEKHRWQRILCETNMTKDIVRSMQTSLNNKGYYKGPIDGDIGWKTLNAITKYQKAKRLSRGGITFELLDSLGITT